MKKIILLALIAFSLNAYAQVSKTVNTTAGNLSVALTASEKQTITNLIITGTIDARDFKTMRDNMPLLVTLDLGEAIVAAYNGLEGTSPWGNNDYPANTIPEAAFLLANWQGKMLTLVKLPKSLTSIGQNAFYSCKGLTTISFPLSCTNIGDDSFSYCTGLANVYIPSTMILIGDRVFMGCTGLINVEEDNPNYSGFEGVLYDKTKTLLIQCPTSKTGTCNIPQSVTKISDYAFRDCKGLITVNLPQSLSYLGPMAFFNCSGLDGTLSIPSSLNVIGNDAFSHCLNLDVVNIPSSVTTIEDYAFYDCGGVFNVEKDNPIYSSEDGIIFNKSKTMLIQCGSSRQAFYDIPSTVTVIGKSAFSRCFNLEGVKIPSSVTIIEMNAFWGCRSMLGSIIIPSAVTSIGNYAFSGCTGLTSIYSYSEEPVNLSNSLQVFYNVNKTSCTLYVPKGSVSSYQSAYQWNEFFSVVEMPGFELSAESVKIEAAQGSNATIEITSDIAWKASSDQSWLTVSPVSGSGNGKLTFTATANSDNTPRFAKITVTASGVEPQIISVAQSYNLLSTITKLYDFDCQYPYSFSYYSRLVSDGIYLYGVMEDISFDTKSKLVRIKPDGSSLEVLHTFDFEGSIDLTYSENMLYGKVNGYELNPFIFKIDTNGLNYTKFNFFFNQNIDFISGPLVISKNTIYGSITEWVNNVAANRLFKANTDGSGYAVIYSSGGNSFRNIILSGNTIIADKYGELIKVNLDGSGFFDFGIYSEIPVIADNNLLFGIMRAYEGTEGYIFKVKMDGTGFAKIKEFGASDFLNSQSGSFSVVGNTLYGLTVDNNGLYKINTDGSGFTKIKHDLQFGEYSTSEGLTLVGNELFGFIGDEVVSSTLFKINTLDDKVSKVFKFGTSSTGMFPMSTLIESDNFLYGNTYSGGSYDLGTIFRINKDGSGFIKLFEFQGRETGVRPIGQLTLIGSTLYGTTSGDYDQIDNGSIFRINIDGTDFTIIHEFDGINSGSPFGTLTLHKGKLYGITLDGGAENHGIIFKINPDGTGFTKISEYSDVDTGESSFNGLAISEEDVIYGVTAIDYGGVFRLNTDGSGLRKIFEFNDESGTISLCKPLLLNDELYITTSDDGAYGYGTIFKIKTDGTGLKVLYNFEGFDDDPYSWSERNNSLMFYNGKLYGTATLNGINDHGYLFEVNLDGTGFTKLSDFNGEYGSMPYLCDLIIDDNEDIYGMTTFGGNFSGGIIYKYSLGEPSTSVRNIAEKTMIQVFPNPANTTLYFNGLTQPSIIMVFDLNGKRIINNQISGTQLDISNLKSGIYILKIIEQGKTTNAKFTKL